MANINHIIDEVVLPVLTNLELRHAVVGKHTVRLGFRGERGAYEVVIHAVQRPPLVLVRIRPHLTLGRERRDAVLEALLGMNYGSWLLKAGLDPLDDEVAFDTELPLYQGGMRREDFTTYLLLILSHFQEAHELLQKVRWGGLSFREALTKDRAPRPRRRRADAAQEPQGRLAREVEELLKDMGEAEAE